MLRPHSFDIRILRNLSVNMNIKRIFLSPLTPSFWFPSKHLEIFVSCMDFPWPPYCNLSNFIIVNQAARWATSQWIMYATLINLIFRIRTVRFCICEISSSSIPFFFQYGNVREKPWLSPVAYQIRRMYPRIQCYNLLYSDVLSLAVHPIWAINIILISLTL